MINLNSQYPTRSTAPTAAYPYGGAQNITTPGDGTGTPWELAIINDYNGMMQAIVTEAAIVPSGSAETVLASDIVDSLKVIAQTIADASRAQYSGATVFTGSMPTSWTDLDLNATVGTNRALIHLSVVPDAQATGLGFRMKGDTADLARPNSDSYGGGTTYGTCEANKMIYMTVVSDASGIIQWDSNVAGSGGTVVRVLAFQVLS